MDDRKTTTEILAERLINSNDIDTFLDTHKTKIDAENFHDFLYRLIDSRGMKISE